MLPDWIKSITEGLRCRRCNHPLSAKDLSAVAITRPTRDMVRTPVYCASFDCPGCNLRTIAEVTGVEWGEFVYAASELCEDITREFGPNGPHPPPPPPFDKLAPPAPPPPSNESVREPAEEKYRDQGPRPPQLRPSRRAGHPRTPISDAEVATFLRQLKRISMKVGSKSWAKFLQRLLQG